MNVQRYLSQCDASILSRVTEDLLRTRRYLDVAEHLLKLLGECVLLPQSRGAVEHVALNTRVTYLSSSGKLATFDLVCPKNGEAAERFLLAPLALALLGAPTSSTVACASAVGVELLEVLRVLPLGFAGEDCAHSGNAATGGQA